MESKRFVLRKSLIGKDKTIKVTFKDGKTATYNHDVVWKQVGSKIEGLNCWAKYGNYTSTNNLPKFVRDLPNLV